MEDKKKKRKKTSTTTTTDQKSKAKPMIMCVYMMPGCGLVGGGGLPVLNGALSITLCTLNVLWF